MFWPGSCPADLRRARARDGGAVAATGGLGSSPSRLIELADELLLKARECTLTEAEEH